MHRGTHACVSSQCSVGPPALAATAPCVLQGISRSLDRLGLDRVDLVQFYWHDYSVRKYVQAAQYLMEERARGRIKHVGVTNFDVPRMQQMMDGGVQIEGNQVRRWHAGVGACGLRPAGGVTAHPPTTDLQSSPRSGAIAAAARCYRFRGACGMGAAWRTSRSGELCTCLKAMAAHRPHHTCSHACGAGARRFNTLC